MRTGRALRNVRIVLVRPRGAANVGAVARAMKNMGMAELVLVAPAMRQGSTGAKMAVHARDILEGARRVESVAAAVADCRAVVGTTRRGGLYRASAESPEQLAPHLIEQSRRGAVALLFGPEDHGLTNDDLKHCQRLIAIDTDSAYASLNLAQAVLLCCYELRRAAAIRSPGPAAGVVAAPAADVQFMFERLQTALLEIGFLNPQNPDHIMFALRRIFGRAILEPHDVRIMLGLARQVEWFAGAARRGKIGAREAMGGERPSGEGRSGQVARGADAAGGRRRTGAGRAGKAPAKG